VSRSSLLALALAASSCGIVERRLGPGKVPVADDDRASTAPSDLVYGADEPAPARAEPAEAAANPRPPAERRSHPIAPRSNGRAPIPTTAGSTTAIS
jgi:hypothetical protein